MEMEAWIEEELETVDIGDKRLNKRMGVVLGRLASRPQGSIPAACKGLAETMGAYRFFDNEKVTEDAALAPHREATIERMGGHRRVLLIQDTTELDYTGHDATEGLGQLSWEERIGLLKHVQLAVTPERLCLGVVSAKIWGRDEKRERDRAKVKKMPIEAKESYRWIEGYREACAVAARLPDTEIVSVGDRENDIYELYVEAQQVAAEGRSVPWIVRSCQDRRLAGETNDGEFEKIRAHMQSQPTVAKVPIRVARSRGRKRCEVLVRIKTDRLRLHPPHRPGQRLPEVELNAVWVEEVRPPKGHEPLQWLLLTSLPVSTRQDALEVVDAYACRWQIEVFFKVLKSGCQVEQLQLQNDARLKACIALYLIVAWRVLYVMMLGRQCPDLPCTVVFEDDEWKAVWTISTETPIPQQPPSLGTLVEHVANLGGWLGRKHDGPPGPKTIWIGLQRTKDFALAWQTFGPRGT
jgi:hypothetical protein